MDHFTNVLPAPPPQKTRLQLIAEKNAEKEEENAAIIALQRQAWDPHTQNPKDGRTTENPHKTLFVARLSYSLDAEHLRQEFEHFGPVEHVHLVRDNEGKSRGYAFIEFRHTRDMEDAYHRANGSKLAGRRILVDYERGRTRTDWIPRRMGGGRGDTRMSKQEKDKLREKEKERERERERERDKERKRPRDYRDNRNQGIRGDRGGYY